MEEKLKRLIEEAYGKDETRKCEKTEEKKRVEAQKANLHTPTPAIDAFIGDEEQTGKKKR